MESRSFLGLHFDYQQYIMLHLLSDSVTVEQKLYPFMETTYLKGRNFQGYLFSQINTDFLLISLFYTDYDGISEKSTFHRYLISQNQQKIHETREN